MLQFYLKYDLDVDMKISSFFKYVIIEFIIQIGVSIIGVSVIRAIQLVEMLALILLMK